MKRFALILVMKRFALFLVMMAVVLASCTDYDSFTSDPSARLTFSTDTVKMDTIFSNTGSATYTFWVFNHGDDGIRIGSVRLKNGNQTGFRVNVDGTYLDNSLGSVATDFEVRRGDSIRVFVELTPAETRQEAPQMVADQLVFQLESGAQQQVQLQAWAWDALKVKDLVVSRDTVIASTVPVVFYGDGVRVDSGAVLTLRNTTLYFHDKAGIDVYGSLVTEGVVLRGDRLDHMFDYLPYDRVSGQWRGLWFAETSVRNTLTDTEIRNAGNAIVLSDSCALDTLSQRLTMTRCTIHNAKGYGVLSFNSNVGLYYCQLTNTLGDCLAIYGGKCDVDHCTLAQFYPFSADRGAALRFSDGDKRFHPKPVAYPLLVLSCRNSILTGYEKDVFFGERDAFVDEAGKPLSEEQRQARGIVFSYRFENCLMRTPAIEDDTLSFKHIQWETPEDSIQGKQHFRTIDEKNLYYDFHLDSLSTAQGKGCYVEQP